MRWVQQGYRQKGGSVPMTKLCRWFGVARRTAYYSQSILQPAAPASVAEEMNQNAVYAATLIA